MSSRFYKTAAEINAYVWVGTGFVRETIVETVDAYGETYNEFMVDEILDSVLQSGPILEDLIVQEYADSAIVEFDGGYDIHGNIEYEGVSTELDPTDIAELEKIVEDFIIPFVDEAVNVAGVEELVWVPVESSNVQEFAYDFENQFLYVRFLPSGTGSFAGGSMYVYHGVEVEIYQLFLQAPSAGKFVHQYLIGRYDFDRLE